MEQFFINAFWATNITLWVALLVLYIILTNKKSLRRKGYNEKYITYLRKSQRIRIGSIAVGLPLVILFSAWIVKMITGVLREEVQLAYIVIVMFIMVIPLKLIDETINRKQIKKLALDTREKVVVDMNYRTLHLIYNPWLELILGVTGLAYSIFLLKIEQWVVYLYLVLPWFMYFTIRNVRYQVRPYLKDNYKYLFAFNIFSFLFFFAYFFVYLIIRIQAGRGDLAYGQVLSRLWLTFGFIISAALIGRISIYLANYRKFNAEISGREIKFPNTGPRKLAFFIVSVLVLVSLTGLGLMTNIVKQKRIQVGRVLEKYIVNQDEERTDTLAIISGTDTSKAMDISRFLKDYEDGNLKLYCRVEDCRSKNIRNFEICCSQTFDRMPMEALVKFEYSPKYTITRLIEE